VKIVVLGAGVVGVATAYYLSQDGHDVTIVDRRATAAVETSYGNAGLYSPSDSYAWASPSALKTAIKSLYRSELGIKYKLRLDPRLWLWSLRFLTQCTGTAAHRNSLRKLRLMVYSKDCLNQLVDDTGIDYDGKSNGIAYFFRSRDGLKAAQKHMGLLRDHGLELEFLDRDGLIALEPCLRASNDIVGAIHSPSCQTGDSHKFANNLADWCATHNGISLRYDTVIERLTVADDRVSEIHTDKGRIAADAFVLAAGAESVFLAESIGIRLPIYPVKGYSITAPIEDPARAPRGGVVDEDRLVAMSPLGNRLRAASSAVFTGFDYGYQPEDFRTILETVRTLFGNSVDCGAAEYWSGLRPMTPSSVPILGPSRYRNLFLNVGHGHVGWSMCCGAGKFVADWIDGRKTEISGEGLIAA